MIAISGSWLLSPVGVQGQTPRRGELAAQAAYMDQLRDQPEKSYEFSKASLWDVLRFLADDAGISFVALPEAGVDDNALVTMTLKASPFVALEAVARANRIALVPEGNVWYLRPYNDQELIGRTYKLQYNTQETVENNGASVNSPSTSGGGIGGTQGSSPDLGLSLQGPTNIFKVNPNPMVNDIKALLGLPVDGMAANLAPEVSVTTLQPLEVPTNSSRNSGRAPTNTKGANGAQVIWNSDSNTLYVVATRQQHEWIEGYLSSVDRPQNLIAIEVKFFETTKDPKKQLGIDWTGTLGDGYGVKLSNINARIDVNGIVNPSTLVGGNIFAPATAVLSADDVAVRLRAFLTDHDTSTVSYPRVLTVNNREVVIRSVINQPVLASSSSVTPGVGGTTTASVSYLPIGTIINILPKTLADNSVVLNISVTVSSIIGTENIGGNNYPIASSRVYTAELHVDSGFTLAIGGLEEAVDNRNRNGVPFLKDVPLIGEAFKSNTRSRSKKNLMIFITPTMLSSTASTGLPKDPISVVPVNPGNPTRPIFTAEGRLVGGDAAFRNAVRWVAFHREFFAQVVEENRTERKTITEIQDLGDLCDLLAQLIGERKAESPERAGDYEQYLAQLSETRAQIDKLLPKAKKDILHF